ncbi:hypothetical protein RQP46_010367 [Phenoliferia psychrophenolica]
MDGLKVITHNIPPLVREPLIALIGQECYTTLVWNLDLTATSCLKYSISKVLGLGIVAGGSIVKVPQILKIVRGKNARGLSLSSYVLDTAGLAITVAYNYRNGFSFSTYGESVLILVQNVVITFLIIIFSASSSRALLLVAFSAFFSLAAGSLLSPSLPLPSLQLLAAACIPLSLASKVPQILSNFSSGSTGQLSAFLVFNSLAGCLARVFTVLTESGGDPVLLWGFIIAAALNAVLAGQMALYWKGEQQPKERITKGVRTAGRKEAVVNVPMDEAPVAVAKEKVAASPKATPKRYVRKLD